MTVFSISRSYVFAPLALLAVLFFTPEAQAEDLIRLGGSRTTLGSMRLLGAAFENVVDSVRVEVLPSLGSSGGVKALSKGALDIALTSRPLKDSEKELGLKAEEYSRTPLIFIAFRDVPVGDLWERDLTAILKGVLTKWPDGELIRLIMREARETEIRILRTLSPGVSHALDEALNRKGLLVAVTDQENADIVEKTPGSLGFSTLAQVFSEKRSCKVLSYNGMVPSSESLDSGTYPIFKNSFIVTRKDASAQALRFVDFIRSAEDGRILEESGNSVSRGF